MAIELERVASEFMSGLDSLDVDRMMSATAQNAQGVDEISRHWLRSRDDVADYLRQLTATVSDVHSELRDAQEQIWGDTGLMTCWLEQDYTIEGNPQHVSAPTTILFRREDGAWKVALFHSIPLPEET